MLHEPPEIKIGCIYMDIYQDLHALLLITDILEDNGQWGSSYCYKVLYCHPEHKELYFSEVFDHNTDMHRALTFVA